MLPNVDNFQYKTKFGKGSAFSERNRHRRILMNHPWESDMSRSFVVGERSDKDNSSLCKTNYSNTRQELMAWNEK